MSKKSTEAILKLLYPKVEAAMKTKLNAFKSCIAQFINKRNQQLFATGPLDRIPYGASDAEEMFRAVGIDRMTIHNAIAETYYWPIASFNPRYAKDEITILLTCIIRYFLLKKDEKNLTLAITYLSFSGKFYPSIHYSMFPIVEPSKYPHVMEYVVNNLSGKFELKVKGNVIGAVQSVGDTWIKSYESDFKSFSDEDIVYVIQQLHNRIKSFVKNVASLYYEAYENKDYLTYNSDNTSEDDYHLADSDMLRAEKAIDRAMSKIQTSNVDYKYCKMSSDVLVKTEEVKQILESILNDKKNIGLVKELVKLLVYTYYDYAPTNRDVSDISFLTYTIAPKPNAKDPHILRIKEIIENWLDTYSDRYRMRKKRLATQNAYTKSIRCYFALIIHTANK